MKTPKYGTPNFRKLPHVPVLGVDLPRLEVLDTSAGGPARDQARRKGFSSVACHYSSTLNSRIPMKKPPK